MTFDNVTDVMAVTRTHEVHAACNIKVSGDPAFSDFDPLGGRFETSETEVRKMVNRINDAVSGNQLVAATVAMSDKP